MITTVTLNPAVDRTILIHDFQPGKVNRIEASHQDAGGKGINVSKVVTSLGGKTLATGLLGGKNGQWIHEALLSHGIATDFIWIEGETRTNIKIVDLSSNENTDINDRGSQVPPETLGILLDKVKELAKVSSVMVFSGSLPQGLPLDTYGQMIQIAKEAQCRTILDAEGEALLQGIEAAPYMIKPNIHELEHTFQVTIRDQQDVIRCGKQLIDKGVQLVVVSLGEEGALLISETEILAAQALPSEIKSTVGAGDSMVGAFALGFHHGLPLEATFQLAIGAATACIRRGTVFNDPEEILQLQKNVRIHKINEKAGMNNGN